MAPEKKDEVVKGVLALFDADEDGAVGWDEWIEGWRAGKRLPDYGVRAFLFRGGGGSLLFLKEGEEKKKGAGRVIRQKDMLNAVWNPAGPRPPWRRRI